MVDTSAYIRRFGQLYDRLRSSLDDERDFQKAVVKWLLASPREYQQVMEAAIPAALKAGDFAALHSCFFQTTRIRLLPGMASGLDHCGGLWPLLDCAACEGTEVLYRVLPPELGLSKNGHPMLVNATNLLMCLLWNRDGTVRFEEAPVIAGAERFIATKRPLWERSVVGFLLCLLRRDAAGMWDQLQSVCASYGRIDTAKFQKLQCLNAYGLVVLARDIFPEGWEPRMPEAANFSSAYMAWRLERTEVPNELYFTYPEPYALANRILAQPVAVRRIFQPYLDREDFSPRERKTWYQDEEAMLEQFVTDMWEGGAPARCKEL